MDGKKKNHRQETARIKILGGNNLDLFEEH